MVYITNYIYLSIIYQMKIQIRKTPLYKPAVYAKLLGRSDVSLALLLQNDVEMSTHDMSCSIHLSTHFGVLFDGINAFIGVPNKLWEAFSTIDWQAFELNSDELQLQLYFDVDVERVEEFRASFGTTSDVIQSVDRLSYTFPIAPIHVKKLKSSAFLHLCEMDEHHERTPTPPISVTKINFKQGS